MKTKLTSLVALSAGLLVSAQAQVMVAGWDFSGYAIESAGYSSIDNISLTGQMDANFSQNLPQFVNAAPFGTVFYDGSFGSTAFELSTGSPDLVVNNNLGTLGGTGGIGASGNINTLFAQGQPNNNAQAIGLTTNGAITFAINMTTFGLGSAGEAWSLAFATQNIGDSNNSSSIAWDYSLNGSDFTSTGFSTAITNNATAGSVDLSSINALDGQSVVYFRGTFSDVTGASYIDNFQVFATAVPEPSSFAALAGVLALGFAAVRRRRQA